MEDEAAQMELSGDEEYGGVGGFEDCCTGAEVHDTCSSDDDAVEVVVKGGRLGDLATWEVGHRSRSEKVVSPRRSPRLLEKQSDSVGDLGGNVRRSPRLLAKNVVQPPAVGMVFDSQDDVEAFYKKYAWATGFGVTKVKGSYGLIDGVKERISSTWQCECYGDPDSKTKRNAKKWAKVAAGLQAGELPKKKPKRRKSKKCDCEALVYAKRNPAEKWVVAKVVLEHKNHKPTPDQAMLIKEHRMTYMNRSVRRKLENDLKAGITLANSHTSAVIDRGGYDNMHLTQKDYRHVADEIRKSKMEGGDCNALIEYFDKMQLSNSGFYHTHRLDEGGHLKDIFWVDARSRAAYDEFSDVVCFDTTYLTNQYALPFANFVGVNHHGQTILFGCALISNEDCETFGWVFRQWLKCMKGKEPGGILTDQAAAMRRPLEEVMPNAKHRWCIWHIFKKMPHKLGNYEKYEDIKTDLLDAVYNSLNTADFERKWAEAIVKYELQNDEWLTNLYVERHMWVPSFMTDYFWAGMRSTQRVESIHSFFDLFMNRHTTLSEFGERYVAAVEKRIQAEKEADDSAVKWNYTCTTGYPYEPFFHNIYTPNKFLMVHKECEKVTFCLITEELEDQSGLIHVAMEDRVWILPEGKVEPILTKHRTMHCVSFNPETREAECSCKMFETHGIICRHQIRVYYKMHIEVLPDKYVLRRWRKDVVRKNTSLRVAYHDLSRTEEVRRLDTIVAAFEPLSDLAAKSQRCTEIVLRGIDRMEAEVQEARAEEIRAEEGAANSSFSQAQSNGLHSNGSSIPESSNVVAANTVSPGNQSQCGTTPNGLSGNNTPTSGIPCRVPIKDPPIPKKRGRPRTTRFKSASETGYKSTKKASGTPCSSKQGHVEKKGKRKGLHPNEPATDENVNSPTENSQPTKIPVKRRKSVSFADVAATPPSPVNLGDDLMNRNSVDFI